MYDAIVVGAGPAGCAAARALAESNARVLLLEAARVPRAKPCAGGVTAKAVALLDPDFHSIVEDAMNKAVFTFNFGSPAEGVAAEPFAFTVLRDRFDHYLVRKAVEAGAEFHDGEPVLVVGHEHRGIVCRTPKGVYRGAFLVGADGANGITAKSLGLKATGSTGMALEALVPLEGPAGAGTFEAAYVDYGCVSSGYGWVFPKRGRVSVGLGSFGRARVKLKGRFYEFVRRVLHRVDAGRLKVRGHPVPLGGCRRRLVAGRAVLAGDAGGLVDPFTGEGIYWALRSGSLAGMAIAGMLSGNGDLNRYQLQVEAEVYPELRAAGILARYFYRFPGFFHRFLVTRTSIPHRFLEVAAGRLSYRALAGIFGRFLR